MTTPRLADLIAEIERIAPPRLAEEWDSAGLTCGDPGSPVSAVVVALEATRRSVAFTARRRAGLLVVHHPPLFRPVATLREDRAPGDVLAAAIRAGVAIYAAHTAFDAARGGMNDVLAEHLGLKNIRPLAPSARDPFVKLITFAPADHVERVAEAIFRAGGGVIGNYTHCAFRHPGTGSFRPGEGTDPFSGTKGEVSYEPEMRLEVRVPRAILPRVIEAMIAAHPYEEVAYDVVPLAGGDRWGIGRVGELPETTRLDDLVARSKKTLGLAAVRVVGPSGRAVRTVAVCAGAGGSLLAAAIRSGAQAFVTGDLGYHQAREAEAMGLAVIDVGHFGSERLFASAMGGRLAQAVARSALSVKIIPFRGDRDPFRIM